MPSLHELTYKMVELLLCSYHNGQSLCTDSFCMAPVLIPIHVRL